MTQLKERDGRVCLPPRLDQSAAGALRDAALSAAGDLRLDASVVSHLSTSAVQVLLAARAHLAGHGRVLQVEGASPDFLSGLRMLGVETGAVGIVDGPA
ncbi:STAS domain-containing protein [Jannaschia sp. S6380]|uniref:STAS domain-containing protein n=1 Tax=Jannaschia sp. S6380 TaxID=2926408 RepID=UPI001FF4A73C|nr:STAS domain-containing protein [Jannaschia sp. S6380]MCK0166601.1 STAS domain-containing protein [Jannaschia sp. S6380]